VIEFFCYQDVTVREISGR